MAYEVDWTTASVHDGTLSVSLSEAPPSLWHQIFADVVSQPIAGVSYTISHSWGPASSSGQTISAPEVIDGVVDEVKNTLNAAVAKTNEIFERTQQEAAQTAIVAREAADQQSQEDQSMTDRFRAS